MPGLAALLLAAAIAHGHAPAAADARQEVPGDSVAADSLARPQPPATAGWGLRLATAVSPDTVTVGDPFVSVVRVLAPAGALVEFLGMDMGDSIQAVDTVRVLGASADSGTTAAYRLVAWVAAPVTATARVRIVRPDGVERMYSLPLAVPAIRSVLPAGEALPPRPGRGVVPLPRRRPLWPWAAVAAVVAALALWVSARRRPARPAPAADPRRAALEALAAAPADADPRFLHELASRVLRRYLAAVDAAWGEEWTSTELLVRVAAEPLPADAVRKLEGILARADRVKFAGSRPETEATARFVGRVAEWIEAYPQPAAAVGRPREAA